MAYEIVRFPYDGTIDADGHVLEHPTAMLQYAPAKFRDRIFHLETKPDGSEVVHYGGHTTSANYLAVAGTGGMSKEDRMRAAAGRFPRNRRSTKTLAPAHAGSASMRSVPAGNL